MVHRRRRPLNPFRNYPRLGWRGNSSADGLEDGAEGAGAGEAGGIDDGPDRGLAVGGPHRPVAIGDLALHDSWTQQPLAAVVCRLDATRMVEEDQELIAGAADLGL